REPHLRLPAGQTENRDGSDRESGRFRAFRAFRVMVTRSTGGRNPAWCGDFGQEKGPGDYPSPYIWWTERGSNPRPLHCESKNTVPISLPLGVISAYLPQYCHTQIESHTDEW